METIVIQFAISRGLGATEQIDRRHDIELLLDVALRGSHLGRCDGGQQGNGSAEIFCEVKTIEKGVEVIKGVCEKHLPSRIIACLKNKERRWQVLDPPGGTISFWGWNASDEIN